jgi:hypothetical protein
MTIRAFYFFSIVLLLTGFSEKTPINDWELKKFESGISIYTRTTENSKFKELKAVFQIKTSLSSGLALLTDYETFP